MSWFGAGNDRDDCDGHGAETRRVPLPEEVAECHSHENREPIEKDVLVPPSCARPPDEGSEGRADEAIGGRLLRRIMGRGGGPDGGGGGPIVVRVEDQEGGGGPPIVLRQRGHEADRRQAEDGNDRGACPLKERRAPGR